MRFLKFFASLKLAVLVILSLAAACATATVLESLYDTATARYYVYASFWFRGILLFLCINLAAVMVDRWPWKVKHAPFLFAHIGIILLLYGSWLTDRTGLDGSLRVSEGEITSIVDVDQPTLVVTEDGKAKSFPVKWVPPGVDFHPISFKKDLGYDFKIQDFISHADPIYSFVPRNPLAQPGEHPEAALKVTISGGPMRITQDFWLWTGDASTKSIQAGPAVLELKGAGDSKIASNGEAPPTHGPRITFQVQKGTLSWRAVSSSGEVVQGHAPFSAIHGKELDPHWKAVKMTLNEFIPDAWVNTNFKTSRVQYGEAAPPSAVHIVVGEGSSQADTWLGMGGRAIMNASGHDVEIAYYPKRLMLPFAVRLDHFTVDRYQGTNNPAAYSSQVTIFGGDEKTPNAQFSQLISMNEPLKYKGITLYQASYEDAQPRPVTSILSVNRDPGRPLKYLGSILIVLGSIWLFAVKYRRAKKPGAPLKTAESNA